MLVVILIKQKFMQAYNWNSFVLRIPVTAPVQNIFFAFTTRQGLETWFLRAAIFTRKGEILNENETVQTGDDYEWKWFGWGDEVIERGKVLDTNLKDFFSFSFGKAGNVSIRMFSEENISMVALQQTEIPTDDESITKFHLGCMQGWLFYLTNLKSILEGGIDLRNRNVELKNVINS